jgi:hypothetical protein
MNCEKAKRNISLLAGDALPPRKARRWRKHLEECETCQIELQEYEVALASLKSFAREEERDWEEAEWKALVERATAEKPEPALSSFRFKPRMAWTCAFIFLLMAGLAALLFRNILRKPPTLELVSEDISLTQPEPQRTFNPTELAPSVRVKDLPFPAKAERIKTSRENLVLASAFSDQKPSQDRLSVTLVSQETGLRVYWTFNKNFEWKEEKR